jgi:hypothetical protein
MTMTPDLIKRENGVRVSEWVLGKYNDLLLCPFKVVRACQTSGGVEWEECDGFGEDVDTFPVPTPDSWRSIEPW